MSFSIIGVITIYEEKENEGLEFVSDSFGAKKETIYKDKQGNIRWKNTDQTISLFEEVLKAKWEMVKKPVTFIEAINSGKKIKHISWVYEYKTIKEVLDILSVLKEETTLNRINGEWLVED